MDVYKTSLNPQIAYYIHDYITSLKRNLMASDTTNKLAREIYLNHQKIFDFIYKNKPNLEEDFTRLLRNFLKSKNYLLRSNDSGYVRFLTPNMATVVDAAGTQKSGWSGGEVFLCEFEYWHDEHVVFKFTAAPAKSVNAVRERLKELIDTELGKKVNNENGYLVFYREKLALNTNEQMRKNHEELPNEFLSFWERTVDPIIQEVDNLLMAHKNELNTGNKPRVTT